MAKSNAAIEVPKQSLANSPLEEHEYVLEDEWATSRTTVFNPRAQWKETWDMFVLVSILYSAIVIPVRICFSAEAEGNMWFFEVGYAQCHAHSSQPRAQLQVTPSSSIHVHTLLRLPLALES